MDEWDALAAKYSKKPTAPSSPPVDPWEALTQKYKAAPAVEQAAPEVATVPAPFAAPLSSMDRVKQGAIDPINGAAQLLYNSLPESVRSAGDRANNWLADKTGLVAPVSSGGLNTDIAAQEQAYQEGRKAAGSTGIDWWRAAGNVISPTNVAIASRAMSVAPAVAKISKPMIGNIAAGVIGAGAQGAAMPVDNPNDYWQQKKEQIGISAGLGAAIPIVGGMLPKNTAGASALKAAGVNVPLGQSIGGVARSLEDKATSIPLLGDAIIASRKKAIEQFNIATLDKVLEPIGEKLPAGAQAGRKAIEWAGQKISAAYDSLLPKLRIQQDAQFSTDMAQLRRMAATDLPDSEASQFSRIMNEWVDKRFTDSGLMNGETMKQVESKLGELARGYGRSAEFEKQQLSDALYQARANLRSMVERGNPEYAPQLQKINASYAALLRPERAATRIGAENGIFTPAQLFESVKVVDPSLKHRSFARGNALMLDWAETAKNTMMSKVADSGSAGRAFVGGAGLGGLSMISPEMATAGALATAAYLPAGRQVASGLLRVSQGASNVIPQRAAYTAPLLTPTLYGLLGNPQGR